MDLACCHGNRSDVIKPAEKIVFISKFCLVTYLEILHACIIPDGTSSKNVSGKVI